jgi:hypothetical protein
MFLEDYIDNLSKIVIIYHELAEEKSFITLFPGERHVELFGKFDKFISDKNIVEDFELSAFVEPAKVEVDHVQTRFGNVGPEIEQVFVQ